MPFHMRGLQTMKSLSFLFLESEELFGFWINFRFLDFISSVLPSCLFIGSFSFCWLFACTYHLVGLVVKASASRAEDPGFESRLRQDFFGVESYQWLKNWHSSGYPARRLALYSQCWDWSAWCKYTVTGWDGKFGLSMSIPEIHSHVAGTLSNQQTNIACTFPEIFLCFRLLTQFARTLTSSPLSL